MLSTIRIRGSSLNLLLSRRAHYSHIQTHATIPLRMRSSFNLDWISSHLLYILTQGSHFNPSWQLPRIPSWNPNSTSRCVEDQAHSCSFSDNTSYRRILSVWAGHAWEFSPADLSDDHLVCRHRGQTSSEQYVCCPDFRDFRVLEFRERSRFFIDYTQTNAFTV